MALWRYSDAMLAEAAYKADCVPGDLGGRTLASFFPRSMV
jgi:hypothetical protein